MNERIILPVLGDAFLFLVFTFGNHTKHEQDHIRQLTKNQAHKGTIPALPLSQSRGKAGMVSVYY